MFGAANTAATQFLQPLKPLELSAYLDKADLVPYLEYNVSDQLQVSVPPIEGWSRLVEPEINFGFNEQVHWFRFTVVNHSNHAAIPLLEIGYPLLDKINVFVLEDGNVIQKQELGDNQPFTQRPIVHENFVLPLSFKPGQALEFYVAVQTSGLAKIPMVLWQKEPFQEQQSSQRLATGIFIGLVLSAIFTSLMVFWMNREFPALLEGGLLFALLMICLTMNGVGFHFFWPKQPQLQQHAVFIFSCFTIFNSALLSVYSQYKVDMFSPFVKWFKGLAISALLLMPLTLFVSYKLGLYLIVAISIVICICHVYAAIWHWRQGAHEEQDINIGLVILLIVLLLIAINNFTPLSLPFSNLTMLQFAVLAMALLVLHSILTTQIVTVKDAEEAGQDNLELELSAQNFQLQETLRELQEKNSELERINTLDALSGIHNRRHFDKRLLAEVRRARRELSPLALVMFDIDHFKKVNDNYGHLAGDEVIKRVASVASEHLQRVTDEAFRYGGEEYALILPTTDLKGAAGLAERIRIAIEQEQIETETGTIQITVSLGVATTIENLIMSTETLIDAADKALYQAKESGRNRVIQYNPEDS